jgi:hypothetical protein
MQAGLVTRRIAVTTAVMGFLQSMLVASLYHMRSTLVIDIVVRHLCDCVCNLQSAAAVVPASGWCCIRGVSTHHANCVLWSLSAAWNLLEAAIAAPIG